MKYAEINQRFTDAVTEYLIDGWTINTATMSGSQGETAKVDLTNGKDIVRIMLDKRYDSKTMGDYITIMVAITNENTRVKPDNFDTWGTLWNHDMTVIREERFYFAGYYNSDWLVGEEEATANHDKQYERVSARRVYIQKPLDIRASNIVLSFVRRQKGCKRAKAEEITVTRYEKYFGVKYKDHHWKMR